MKKTLGVALFAALLLSITAAQADEQLTSFEMQADTNGDDKVSYAEFKAAHEARLKTRFERLDINGDGYVDFEEKQVAKQKQAKRKAAEKEAMRQSLREQLREERKTRKRHYYKY